MKHITLSLFTLLVLNSLVLLHSCAPTEDEDPPCKSSPPQYYTLSAAQKAIIPYKGFDTISMVSNMGDTVHCIGNGKQYFNVMEFDENSHPACAGYGTEMFYEAYKIEFVDSLKNGRIEVIHYLNYLSVPFNWSETIFIGYKGANGLVRPDQISLVGAYNFIGNIDIRGKSYFKVTKAESESLDSNVFVLINKTEGIIKIQLNENEKWELLPD